MPPADREPRAGSGFWRTVLTLLAAGTLAQALPLLLGPWLARLYSPADWGAFALFTAVASNLAVVACARYDLALPLAREDGAARDLLALCLRIGLAVTVACGLVVALALSVVSSWSPAVTTRIDEYLVLWMWLPAAVAAGALVQALAMWASRAQRFGPLATARVVQFGGGALAQGAAGSLWAAGPLGLVVGPVLASLAAALCLRRPAPLGGWRSVWQVPRSNWQQAARRHRDFPWLNAPHAFLGALQDTLAIAIITGWTGDAAAGLWAFALRYLKAPATLVGGAVSQVLYPQLVALDGADGLRALRRTVAVLTALAMLLAVAIVALAAPMFAWVFGATWASAGELSQALALYFVASPLGVVTLAWHAQAWALRVALLGQGLFLAALVLGLAQGGLAGAAWSVSVVMALFYAGYAGALMSGRVGAPSRAALPPPVGAAGADNQVG
jgi:O-antigen/teichoic acid export membrane protein